MNSIVDEEGTKGIECLVGRKITIKQSEDLTSRSFRGLIIEVLERYRRTHQLAKNVLEFGDSPIVVVKKRLPICPWYSKKRTDAVKGKRVRKTTALFEKGHRGATNRRCDTLSEFASAPWWPETLAPFARNAGGRVPCNQLYRVGVDCTAAKRTRRVRLIRPRDNKLPRTRCVLGTNLRRLLTEGQGERLPCHILVAAQSK